MRASALTRTGVLTGVVDCVVLTSTTVAVPLAGATGGVSGAASSTGGGFVVARGVEGDDFEVAAVPDGPVAGDDATKDRDGVATPVTTSDSVCLVVPGGRCAATPGAG
jgi:hypothetical protein